VTDSQGSFSSIRPTGNRAWGWRCHDRRLGAQAHRLEDQKLTRLLLHDLGNEVKWVFSPTTMEMDGGKLTMARRFGQLLATVWVASCGAPAPGMTSAVAVVAGDPPLSKNSA
jgi:hypothetical protein